MLSATKIHDEIYKSQATEPNDVFITQFRVRCNKKTVKNKNKEHQNLPVVRRAIRFAAEKLAAAVTRQQLGLETVQSLSNFRMSALRDRIRREQK